MRSRVAIIVQCGIAAGLAEEEIGVAPALMIAELVRQRERDIR